MSVRIYKTVEVEVDIDESDIVDLREEELAKLGLYRALTSGESLETSKPLDEQWLGVRRAITSGDHRELINLLGAMAWSQAGVMLPITPMLASVRA